MLHRQSRIGSPSLRRKSYSVIDLSGPPIQRAGVSRLEECRRVEPTCQLRACQELALRHPGTVLSRSQIIEAVWDFAYDGTSNVVDQYVNYLRRKVDIPFARRDIETVRGMGYRLRHEDPR